MFYAEIICCSKIKFAKLQIVCFTALHQITNDDDDYHQELNSYISELK